MNRRPDRNTHIAGELPDQHLPDRPGAPMRLVPLGLDDQPLDRPRQLIGIANRAPRSIGQSLYAFLLIAIENLVAGLSRNPECISHIAHAFAVQETRYEAQTSAGKQSPACFRSPPHSMTDLSIHGINTARKAERVTHASGTKCHLCLGSGRAARRPLVGQTAPPSLRRR